MKTLKEILLVSGLFHVFVSDNGAVAYRGNDQPVDLTIDGPGALSFSVFFAYRRTLNEQVAGSGACDSEGGGLCCS